MRTVLHVKISMNVLCLLGAKFAPIIVLIPLAAFTAPALQQATHCLTMDAPAWILMSVQLEHTPAQQPKAALIFREDSAACHSSVRPTTGGQQTGAVSVCPVSRIASVCPCLSESPSTTSPSPPISPHLLLCSAWARPAPYPGMTSS